MGAKAPFFYTCYGVVEPAMELKYLKKVAENSHFF